MNNLKEYNKKRNFNITKEPIGIKEKPSKKLLFVVQHHIATKDHYDLRLEYNGTLKSWAIPKGPSYNTNDKRLAVKVEDHPLSYKNFEGNIPEGEYGAGTVMIWDKGYWQPTNTSKPNFNNGTIKFILKGKRLKGAWSLIHFKDNNWLLIKEKDNIKGYKNIKKIETSIKSGLTMNEIKNNIKSQKDTNIINEIKISNPNKIIYDNPKITKIDIVKYYQKVASRMLPLIEGRIISTIRCPSGIKKEKFFKKHFDTKNKGIGKINLTKSKNKRNDYYYIKNESGLISEVQMNSFEFHIWGSKAKKLEKPDMMVFDLDPDEKMNLKKIREGVKDLKSILDIFSLKSYLKTSGGKGYHIIVKINNVDWKEFRKIAKNIAKLMEQRWPDKYTSNIRKEKRKGKIFIDWIRNTKGATSVAPYSIRLKEKCSVSMPIKWSELDKIAPNQITIEEAIKRLKRKNPWEDIID